jgi:CheY-like chemotaxis protein
MTTRILWVDDEYSRLPDLANKFSKLGFEVDCADSVIKAQTLLDENQYQCVVLDMILPYGGTLPTNSESIETMKSYLGLDVLRRIEEKRGTKSFPKIVVLTIVDEERLAKRLQALKRKGSVGEILYKRPGLDLDGIVKAVQRALEGSL